ncbi:MAG: hypothetical protein AB1633_03620 [Elusimicrobiota bacterium]
MRIEERGRPELKAMEPVKERMLELIEEMRVTHIQRLRKAYNDRFRNNHRKISWATLKKYLNEVNIYGLTPVAFLNTSFACPVSSFS